MKQYRVIAGAVFCDKLNKHFASQDIVSEEQFHEGHAAELVAQGFLQELDRFPADDEQRPAINEEDSQQPAKTAEEQPTVPEAPAAPEVTEKPKTKGRK